MCGGTRKNTHAKKRIKKTSPGIKDERYLGMFFSSKKCICLDKKGAILYIT